MLLFFLDYITTIVSRSHLFVNFIPKHVHRHSRLIYEANLFNKNFNSFNNFSITLKCSVELNFEFNVTVDGCIIVTRNNIQWTLSISTTLYLELLSISNKKLGPLDICVLSKLFLSLYLELLYLEFFSISNKNLGPLQLFLSLSRTFSCLRVHLHSK